MLIRCEPVQVVDEDGVTTFGAEFAPPREGHFMAQLYSDGSYDPQFGNVPYLEFSDQRNGRYGGIRSVELAADHLSVQLLLGFDVPGFGRDVALVFERPFDDQAAFWLSKLPDPQEGT